MAMWIILLVNGKILLPQTFKLCIAVHYWDELKKVLACFGDSCKDFDIVEDSDFGAALIKEGFTLEFMKNALIKPVLSLRNKDLLLDWWKQVEAGNPEAPLPPESEIFKSDHYSSFIYLYFKMATEVNVFAHLGQSLVSAMKESLFSDKEEADSDDEEAQELPEANGAPDNNKTDDNDNTREEPVENHNQEHAETNGNNANGAETVIGESVTEPQEEEKPKTITSMYGKVYTLKK